MSQAQFDKAAQIVTTLPSDGLVKPSDDDSLYVSKRLSKPASCLMHYTSCMPASNKVSTHLFLSD